jgi:prevent-host-death family protein
VKIAPVADVKARLSSYLDHAETTGPVVITRNGKPAAVLIAPADEDELERLVLSHSPKFLAMLKRSFNDIARGNTVSAKEFFQSTPSPAKRPNRAKQKRS